MMKFTRRLSVVIKTAVVMTAFLFSGFNTFAQQPHGVIIEGESLEGVRIGKSTESDVISLYGKAFKLVEHNKYSFEVVYNNLGLGFYYCSNDPKKEIFLVRVESPFQATTSKGMILGQSTFADVFGIYGAVAENSAGFEFEGINFHYQTEKEKAAFDDKLYINRKIKEVKAEEVVGKISTFDTQVLPLVSLNLNTLNLSGSQVESKTNVDPDEKSKEDEKILEATKEKIVSRIELIEKSGLRQCHVKFPNSEPR